MYIQNFIIKMCKIQVQREIVRGNNNFVENVDLISYISKPSVMPFSRDVSFLT